MTSRQRRRNDSRDIALDQHREFSRAKYIKAEWVPIRIVVMPSDETDAEASEKEPESC